MFEKFGGVSPMDRVRNNEVCIRAVTVLFSLISF